MENEINLYDLEKKLVPRELWHNQVPAFIINKMEPDDFLQPIGVGYDDEISWFMLIRLTPKNNI